MRFKTCDSSCSDTNNDVLPGSLPSMLLLLTASSVHLIAGHKGSTASVPNGKRQPNSPVASG